MQRKEIYLASIHYRYANYNRPCVILETLPNRHLVGMISSSMDLYKENYDFLIRSNHPDFPATGLKRTCYVMRVVFPEIEDSQIVEKWGVLTGDLAKDFEDWIG